MIDLKNKEIVVYGYPQNWYDLQYVFTDVSFVTQTQDLDELFDFIRNGKNAVLCLPDKQKVHESICSIFGNDRCFIDSELILFLNYPLKRKLKNRKLYIWGTGYWCDRFVDWLGDLAEIEAFVDNNIKIQGQKKRGRRIIAPLEICTDDAFVVVATNAFNYFEITESLKDVGIRKENYVSALTVMEDVAGYFRKVYESTTYYPVYCENRDENIRVLYSGDICTCCLSRKSVYGNVLISEFDEIWNGIRARISRLSLEKKAYTYCEKSRCPYLCGINEENRNLQMIIGKQIENKGYSIYPESIAPEIDTSCNLYCRSCRDKLYVDNGRERDIYTEVIIKKIVHLPTRLIINTVGEPLASKNCLKLLDNPETQKKNKISIYTNGTLLYPERLMSILDSYETIELSISIDAASKETYEKLRRGGDFDRLLDNLKFVSKRKIEGRVSYLQLNFVVQADNIHEMEAFVELAKEFCADKIAMNAIENWGNISDEEYKRVSVMDSKGIKEIYREYFTEKLVGEPEIIWHNLSHSLGVKPKRMYMI